MIKIGENLKSPDVGVAMAMAPVTNVGWTSDGGYPQGEFRRKAPVLTWPGSRETPGSETGLITTRARAGFRPRGSSPCDAGCASPLALPVSANGFIALGQRAVCPSQIFWRNGARRRLQGGLKGLPLAEAYSLAGVSSFVVCPARPQRTMVCPTTGPLEVHVDSDGPIIRIGVTAESPLLRKGGFCRTTMEYSQGEQVRQGGFGPTDPAPLELRMPAFGGRLWRGAIRLGDRRPWTPEVKRNGVPEAAPELQGSASDSVGGPDAAAGTCPDAERLAENRQRASAPGTKACGCARHPGAAGPAPGATASCGSRPASTGRVVAGRSDPAA